MDILQRKALIEIKSITDPVKESLIYNQHPPIRWIVMLRTALGMKSRQLAERVGVSRQAIERIEKDEGEKSLNTDTLENIADALGCKFVYAFVPKEDPLIFVDKAAQQKAIEIVDSLQHTMALEDQKTNQQSRDELIANIKQQLLSNPLKEGLWDK